MSTYGKLTDEVVLESIDVIISMREIYLEVELKEKTLKNKKD